MNLTEQMISRVFYDRNFAHLEHWKTKSYAEHQAFGDFYEGIIELIDKLVETYQGAFDIIGDVEVYEPSKNVLQYLKTEVAWIAQNRESISQDVSALENIIDEIVALYLKTIYKLENLK